MTDSDVYEVAEAAARAYCKRYASSEQFDDALGDAALFLLEHRTIWNKQRSLIVSRVVGALIRKYQNEHGLRLKRKPTFVDDVDVSLIPSKSNVLICDPRLEFVQTLLESLRFAPLRDAILEIIDARSKISEIAARNYLSQRELRRIYNEFQIACKTNARGVTIVDPHDVNEDGVREACPLFFA